MLREFSSYHECECTWYVDQIRKLEYHHGSMETNPEEVLDCECTHYRFAYGLPNHPPESKKKVNHPGEAQHSS